MSYELIIASPKVEDFTALDQHQEQTPQSFFGAKPVLHLHSPAAKVVLSQADLQVNKDFAGLGARIDGPDGSVEFSDVDVWVTSRSLLLWPTSGTGLKIPYPTITIHAQQGSAVLLELNLSDDNTADEDLEFIQLRICPTSVTNSATEAAEQVDGAQANGDRAASPVKALYDAISACQELNPDPNADGDDEEDGMGGFDETAPGATGWITSENMGDFMDEEGNLRMPEGATVIGGEEEVNGGVEEQTNGLGAGAGRRRGADEVDARDGVTEDETKWQRTG